jgi:hypothetical protein
MTENRLCEVCTAVIDSERVEVLPETQLCTGCARKVEKFGGEFIAHLHQERTSKPGSIKINYGGVSLVKTRNYDGVRRLKAQLEAERLAAG